MQYTTNLPISQPEFTKLIEWIELWIEDKYELCEYANIKITQYLDLSNIEWFEELTRKKITKSINTAREEVIKGLKDNPEFSLKYLERKKKDEFSIKQVTESTNTTRILNIQNVYNLIEAQSQNTITPNSYTDLQTQTQDSIDTSYKAELFFDAEPISEFEYRED